MKFWAKVRFKGGEDASELIWAFFKEFNSESSITLTGKEAKIEILFNQNPPMEIIKALKQCDVAEFYFGKALGEHCEDEFLQETGKEEKTLEKIEELVTDESESSKQNQDVASDGQIPEESKKRKRGPRKARTTKVENIEFVTIPIFEEIAKKSESFEHFVKQVAEWLEMGKKTEFFENLVLAGSEIEHVSWKELDSSLQQKGISFNQWDKIFTGQRISERLKEYSLTTLTLVSVMKRYKEGLSIYLQGSEENVVSRQLSEEAVANVEEIPVQAEETTTQSIIETEHMPEIPCFTEIIGKVDKTKPIDERVRYVLNQMGLEKQGDEERAEIFEIANTAVRVKEMFFGTIFSKVKNPIESQAKARMIFSKFINDFVSEYNPNIKVKLLDFLKQLQKGVINEGEI